MTLQLRIIHRSGRKCVNGKGSGQSVQNYINNHFATNSSTNSQTLLRQRFWLCLLMLLSFRLGLDLVIYFFKYDIHCICHFKSYVFYCCIAYALLACTTLISPSNLSFDHNNPNIIYLDHLKINWSYHMKELYAFSFNSHRKNLMSWLIPSTKP